MMDRRRAWIGAGALATALVAGTVVAAPGRAPRPPQDAGAGPDRPAMTAEQARARLADRLKDAEREAQSLRDALARLDAGEPWEQVREGLSDRAGGPGAVEGWRERVRDRMGEGPGPGDFDRRLERRRERFEPLTPEGEAELLALLREIDPEGAARYDAFKAERPAMAQRLLRMIEARLRELERMEGAEPERYRIGAEQFRVESAIMHTARTLHEAVAGGGAADLDAARDRLRALVTQQVDLTLEAREMDLERGVTRLERARVAVAEERARRDQMISERVDRIVDRAIRVGLERLDGPDGPEGPAPADGAPARR